MNKALLLIFFLLISFIDTKGQGQYTFTYTPSVSNTIPFNTAYSATSNSNRQLIYYPTNFPTAPSGFITTIYLRTENPGTPNFTNLYLRMGYTSQLIFTATTGGNNWIPNLTTVYTGTFTGTAGLGTWMAIPLQTPFWYDATQNFVLEMGHTGFTSGFAFYQGNGAFTGRGMFGSANNPTGSVQHRLAELSFDMAPLPVKLISFEAKAKKGINTLSWNVGEESNMEQYIVERSTDGKTYEAIGAVASKGSSEHVQQYSFTDNKPPSGTTYYRLKMVEQNGSSTHSPVARIHPAGSSMFSVDAYPNPFTDEVRLSVTASEPGLLTYDLKDLTGRTVRSGTYSIQTGANQVTIDNLEALEHGVYSLVVHTGEQQQTLKLSK